MTKETGKIGDVEMTNQEKVAKTNQVEFRMKFEKRVTPCV